MSHSSGMHVRTGASHKRRCTGDRAMQVFPTRRHPTSLPRPTLRARRHTDSDMHIVQLSHLILHASVWHAYCTAITLHFACLFFQRVTPSQGPLLPPGAPHPGGASASAVSASIVCAPSCSTWCGTTSSLKAGAGRGSVWHAR